MSEDKPAAPEPPRIEVVKVDEGDNQEGLRIRVVSVKSESPRYRDNGKIFLITEKPAMQAELWALRVLKVLVASGVDIGGDPTSMGMRGLAVHGMTAVGSMSEELLGDLLREMMSCVRVMPDYQRLRNESRPLAPTDIQELPTLFLLKREVFDIHTGFLEPVVHSTSSQARNLGSTVNDSRGTQTSRAQSAPRSAAVARR